MIVPVFLGRRRSAARYVVGRLMEKSSTISAMVCFPEAAVGLGDFHSFARAHADEVRFEFSEHRQDVKQQFADGVGGVVDGTIDVEFDFASGEVVGYFVVIRDGTG